MIILCVLTVAWAAEMVLHVDPGLAGSESMDGRFASVSSAVAHVTKAGRADSIILLLKPGLYIENNTVALSCTDNQTVSLTSTGFVRACRVIVIFFFTNTLLLLQTVACCSSLLASVAEVHSGRQ